MKLFVDDKQAISNEFILFHRIKTLINNTTPKDGKPIYLRLGKKRYDRLSNLEIYQPILDDSVDELELKKLLDMGFPTKLAHRALIINATLDDAINWVLQRDESYDIDAKSPRPKALAYFYNHYHYTKGLSELIKNQERYKNDFKIYIDSSNRDDGKLDMYIHVYMNKMFLYNIYEAQNVPALLINIIKEDSVKIKNEYSSIKNTTNLTVNNVPHSDIHLTANYKRELFKYQKYNVVKMKDIETKIKHGYNYYETFLLTTADKDIPEEEKYSVANEFMIKDLNERIFLSDKDKMMHESNLKFDKLYTFGGVLADDIGLGKTCSMIGLMMESYNEKTSLVVCPTRLCKQWMGEINITGDLKCTIISSISQFKKIKDKINDYDVVIVSYNFLTNKNYHKYITENPETISLTGYFWERVILDEGHEYLSDIRIKKPNFEVRNELYKFKSNFRWLCTGTPYTSNLSFWNLIYYLVQSEKNAQFGFSSLGVNDLPLTWENRFHPECGSPNYSLFCEKFYHILNHFSEDLFIKNTKESVSSYVSIPEFTINTKFLTQTSIERTIYDSALGDEEKMIQLCNHILVSDHHINILGNKPLPLDEIHEKMTVYYRNKILRIDKQRQNLLSTEPHLKTPEILLKINELVSDLSLNKSKLAIFEKLNEKVEEVDSCPICYDDFESKTRSITPCGHFMCSSCICTIFQSQNNASTQCPICRFKFNKKDLEFVKSQDDGLTVDPNNKWGTKMSELIKYINEILAITNDNRFIIFSQWDSMLKLVGKVLAESNINHLFLNGSMHVINGRIKKFKLDSSVRVVLLSSEKAASGLNLTEASHIVLLDTLNNNKESSKIIEEQAIGRSVRIGQKKNVHVQRFIMRDTIEHDYYLRNISE